MPNNLIFNPFLEIHIDSEVETDFLLLAPKKNVGLQILRLNKTLDAKLLNLLNAYSKIGLNYVEIDDELTSDEIELFQTNAILVDDSEKPVKPLFSCQLETVEVSDVAKANDLIVNPTFRFEPMNLATFKEWIYQKHYSPQQATAWIENPVTKIEIGYWLTPEQTEIVSKFEKGQQIIFDLEEEILNKLISAQIIVSQKQFEAETENWKDVVANARLEFKKNRYIAVEKLLPKSQMNAMQMFYKEYISQGFMEFGDEFVNRRFRQHNEPLARQFHFNYASLMSIITGQKIIPSYCYAASYKEGAELKPHTDREQCEFSISFQVDYEPKQDNDVSPWDLCLATPKTKFEGKVKFEWDEFENDPELSSNSSSVKLKNGDGLFYKGRDLIHYRYSLPKDHRSTSLFFHYVPADFDGKLS